jgi:hypothetical protein
MENLRVEKCKPATGSKIKTPEMLGEIGVVISAKDAIVISG